MRLVHSSDWCIAASARGVVDVTHLKAEYKLFRRMLDVPCQRQLELWCRFFDEKWDGLMREEWTIEEKPFALWGPEGPGEIGSIVHAEDAETTESTEEPAPPPVLLPPAPPWKEFPTHREHKFFGRVVLEYPLPADAMPEEIRDAAGDWFAGIIGADPQGVRESLRQRWSKLQAPCNQLLRDRLLEFQPISIVLHGQKCWLRIRLPRLSAMEEYATGNSIYLPAPVAPGLAAERLQSFGLLGNLAFHEFLVAFGGLRESMPPWDGSFLADETWKQLNGAWMNNAFGFESWKDAVVVFGASNGDAAVLHPNGRIAGLSTTATDSKNVFRLLKNLSPITSNAISIFHIRSIRTDQRNKVADDDSR